MSKKEINHCHEAGCGGAHCCGNIRIVLTQDEVNRTPDAHYIHERRKIDRAVPGLYYWDKNPLDHDGIYLGFILGDCPKLKTNHDGTKHCGDYENRYLACRATQRGEETCNDSREKNGLPSIKKED